MECRGRSTLHEDKRKVTLGKVMAKWRRRLGAKNILVVGLEAIRKIGSETREGLRQKCSKK
jgi:hypothetical protein